MPTLLAHLKTDHQLRWFLAHVIASVLETDEQMVPHLLTLSGHPHWRIRQAALSKLARLGDGLERPETQQRFEQALDDEDPRVVQVAYSVLREQRGRRDALR